MGANAQISVPAFTIGQVLTAQQQTEINTGVPVFATTTTRDAAFGGTGEKVLAQGQLAYIEASDVVQYYNGTTWATLAPTTSGVVQVKSAAKTDTFSTTSTTFTDVTGLSIAITPTSASNKVLIVAQIAVGTNASGGAPGHYRLTGGNATNYVGDTASNRVRGVFGGYTNAALSQLVLGMSIVYLDSPATTSATTYKVQVRVPTGSDTAYVNRSSLDGDDAYNVRGASSITVMEVAP